MKLRPVLLLVLIGAAPEISQAQEYLGQRSANPYNPQSTGNPYGQYGNPYPLSCARNPNASQGPVIVSL